LERRQVVDVQPIELESDVEPVVSPPEPVDEAELDDDAAVAEDESEEVVDESADEPEEEPEDEEPEEPVEETEDEEDSGDSSGDSLEEDNGEGKE